MNRLTPRDLLLSHRLLVFCGSGGVGKTTVAAATAVWAALAGRKVLVMTIDPARRLANALGLDSLDSTEKKVPLDKLGFANAQGELHAMMMDTKRVMDQLILDYSPSPEIAERILKQRIYQAMSDSMIGAQEVVSLGKLYELYFKRNYDLIVVDTAPTKHAIDFFETPSRLINIFDMEALRWFLRPMEAVSSFGFGIFKKSANLLGDLVEKALGISALTEIANFFSSVQELAGVFKERSERILAILQDPALTIFNVVTSPQRHAIDEALYIAHKLHKLHLAVGFKVVNRVAMLQGSNQPFAPPPSLGTEARATLSKELAQLGLDLADLEEIERMTTAMAQHDRDNITFLEQKLPPDQQRIPLLMAPFLSTEISDVGGLLSLAERLYGTI